MAEYIEREALLTKMKKLFNKEELKVNTSNDIARAAILLAEYEPAADVAEVRHGKWERKENKKFYWYACSLCGEEVLQNERGDDYFSDYCPNCGAKMDVGDDVE